MATIIIGNVSMVSDGDYVTASSHNKNHYVYVSTDNITYVSLKDNNAVTPANDHVNWQILCKGIGVTTDNNYTNVEKTKLTNIESLADVTDSNNVGIAINGSNAKTTPIDADTVGLIDSASSNVLSKLSWANIKATLRTYFDTLYNLYVHPTGDGNHHVPATSTTNSGKILKAGTTAGSESWGTLTATDVSAIPASQKGTASGVASTNASNQVIQDALNALSLGGNLASLYPIISSGTWTPEIYGDTTAGNPTYVAQSGTYYKIGKLAFARFSLQVSSLGGMAGYVHIGGLPFDTSYGHCDFHQTFGLALPSGYVLSSATTYGTGINMVLQKGNTGNIATVDSTEISASLNITDASGWYITI